mgnify:CR=1 FL=1
MNMKKITYIAAALLAFVGCAKQEIVPQTADTQSISVTLPVAEELTKAHFDGASHIKFDKGDAFYAAIAKTASPTQAVQVASKAGYPANTNYALFNLVDSEASEPTFKGNFYSITEANFEDKYIVYGLFPSTYASGSSSDLTKWTIKLPETQDEATQETWHGKADALLAKPSIISTAEHTFDDTYKEYSLARPNEKIEFAHLFGFGKLSFAGIPEQYKDLVVKSVSIKAVGTKKDIAGTFYVNVTTEIDELGDLKASKPKDCITLKGDGTTTISDYKAWFVANPGTYDVEITVSTAKADFVFKRSELIVTRGVITEPTVNYGKVADDAAISHDVALAEGETWTTGVLKSGDCMSSSTPIKAWGAGEKKMNFFVDYVYLGASNSNSPSPCTDYSSGKCVQGLTSKTLMGGAALLSSEASFSGMTQIKLNCGVYTPSATADFTVYSELEGKQTQIGKVTVEGTNANVDGKNFFFDVPEAGRAGVLVVKADNLSPEDARPYVGSITINPDAEIVLGQTTLKVAKTASANEISCGIFAAKGEPTVKVAEDAASWITGAAYADGKLTFNVAENAGSKRTGVVTVTVKGLTDVSETLTVVQASATAVEYKFKITAETLKAAIAAATEGGATFSEWDSFTTSFTATATDGSGKTTDVELIFKDLGMQDSVSDSFKMKSTGTVTTTSSIGFIENVCVVSTGKTATNPTSYTDVAIKTSTDGSTWAILKGGLYEKNDVYYTNTFTNEDESQVWFQMCCGGWNILRFKSIELTYVAE